MSRHRQVRLSYPPDFVELAVYLARRHGRRRAASALQLPLSTIYRWFDASRERRAAPDAGQGTAHPDRLVVACEAHGFDLRARVRTLEPLAPVSRVARQAQTPVAAIAAPDAATAAGCRANVSDAVETGTSVSPGVHLRLQRARNEIDQRYYAPLSCEQLAALAGMSRFHFIRTFKNAYSVSPYRYLMQVRVRHARALLGTTRQPLDAVAAAVGFDSQSSLCKAFRSIEGISLSAFFRGVRLGAQPPQRSAAVAPSAVAHA